MIGAVVLAAGGSARFGTPKQLALLDGRPLLEHALATAARAPVGPVVVVLGREADAVLERVELHGARPVVCARWAEGQAVSLACGLAELPDCEAVAVLLGDQPRVRAEAVARVVAARGGGALAVRASYGGVPGHPVVLERALFARLHAARGDDGARAELARAPVTTVPCDDLGGGEDVDTPAELRAL
jgi:nicotine blue oxidoreductase